MKKYKNEGDYITGRLVIGAIMFGIIGLYCLIHWLITGELPKEK